MRIGSLYVYSDTASGRPMYVGSTQDGDTMRRHREHLKEKRSIGPWLRSFVEPPVPTEIRRYRYGSAKRLHRYEDHFMKVLGTMRLRGGLNIFLASIRPDHSEIGRIGGSIGNREGKARGGRAGGPLGSRKGKACGGRNQPREDKVRGGLLSTHIRWHINRGIKKVGCDLCAA